MIFLTGHADVPTAVERFKRGAFDSSRSVLEQPLVDRIAEHSGSARSVHDRASATRKRRLDDLTEREREVMRQVAQGLPNKLIASALDISVRTVELHRSRVFEKLGVKSAAELANLLHEMGIAPGPFSGREDSSVG